MLKLLSRVQVVCASEVGRQHWDYFKYSSCSGIKSKEAFVDMDLMVMCERLRCLPGVWWIVAALCPCPESVLFVKRSHREAFHSPQPFIPGCQTAPVRAGTQVKMIPVNIPSSHAVVPVSSQPGLWQRDYTLPRTDSMFQISV